MKYRVLFIIGVVCLMASCAQEKFDNTIIPTPGEEVRFSASVNEGPQTRTLYGADAADSIRVKWVNGDTISVFGTTGGKQQAKYTVLAETASSNTPNVNDGQVYADDLQKTAINGVQWGEEETANFTAIYPSLGSSFPKDGQIKATINATQNYVFPADPIADKLTGVDVDGNPAEIDLWEGTHFGNNASNPTMQNAIMYARTEGVKNGDTVNLLFKPFATVLKFRFMGFNSSLTDPTIHVQSITVTAPTGYAIAGDFTLDVTGSYDEATATATAAGNNSNTITLNTILPGGTYLPLKKHQAVDFNVFTVPLDNLKMGGAVTKETVNGKATYTCEHPWKITIQTAQHGTFTYNVIPNVNGITELEDGTYTAASFTLAKGQIHKVKVPQLTVNGEVTWDYSKWMTQIPPKVYLSELSIPGTWYSVHSAYQNTTDLAKQYTAGIRAFNIDCRMTPSSFENGLFNDTYGPLQLVCAGTDKWTTGGVVFGSLVPGTTVLNALKTIASQIQPKEYVVVVLTIAEKPLTSSGSAHGGATVDPATVIPEITNILNANASDLKIYTKKITSTTTVEDVLNHMIIKINTNNSSIGEEYSYTYPNYALVSYGSMATPDWNNNNDNISDLDSDYYTTMQTDQMYWGNNSTDLTYYYHQCQRTVTDGTTVSGVPTISDRKSAIDNIITESTKIYDASTHNGWFQLGIGGYVDNGSWGDDADQAAISTALNDYVSKKIESKMETDPSPVGIVLMNHATDASGNGIQLVKDIVNMNGKFYLKRAGGDVITGDGDGSDSTNPQAVPTSNGAYAVVGEDAF